MNKKVKEHILKISSSKSPLIYKVKTKKTSLLKGTIVQINEINGTTAHGLNFIADNPVPVIIHLSTRELSLITG